MNFNYELNKQDLIDFNMFHITYSKLTRRTFFLQRYIISLSFLILPFFLKEFTSIPFVYWIFIFGLLYVYWVVYFPKRLEKIVTKKITAMLAGGKNQSVVGAHDLSVSEEGIVDKSAQSEVRTPFNGIEDIVEDKNHIFVYVSSNSAHIIPYRIFADEGQKSELLGFLKEKRLAVSP
ncbi:hypothetical protein Desor_3557 [Desulfosporosinus orientis DSM 765]|uniref:YcxB-like C-terminal domain-containing protein n=1 Tax=Desulfosporosinus orientis (strain ATCC 19365 / DSM 765 / NCIMB 8382 / VKM B-1628 / Singapore I) TaxID=768706 RepID=G7WIG5_DESOD|nr:YcxB family protein [Desulfosporosinus orientis]AET69039.1 hypothetical protein Desor_3557 [Desulfosporosinus orientis DSM 765]